MRLSRFIFCLSPAFSQHLVLRALRTPANSSWFVRLEAAMRYETMTLGSNVIRFPVELRAKPSIDLLIEIAPDSREVELIAEAFGFDPPDPEARSKADRAMAETIAKASLPADPKERRVALNEMLKPLIDRAVAACAEARQAALYSDEAGAKLAGAQMEGGYWLAPLEDAANHWAVESARAAAHRPCGRAGGPWSRARD
jgi:hypothetical protein